MAGFIVERGLLNETIPLSMTWDIGDPDGHLQVLAILDAADGAAHALDSPATGLWFLSSNGTDLTITPWRVDATHVWAAATGIAAGAGKSPSLVRREDGQLSAAYVASGNAKRAVWNPGEAVMEHVETIGAGTHVVHTLDALGRCVAMVYNSGWFAYVGERGDGVETHTWRGPVSLALSSSARQGSLLPIPGGPLFFAHVNASGAVEIYYTRKLTKQAVGTWTLLRSVGAGTRVAMALDVHGRLIVAVYDTAWKVHVAERADASLASWTWRGPVSMALGSATERGAHLLRLDSVLSFAYKSSASVVARAECRKITKAGVGTWP